MSDVRDARELAPSYAVRDASGHVNVLARAFLAIDAEGARLSQSRERLQEALEAMMPGVLASEREYLTNPAYHACVYIAREALGEGL